MSTFLDLLRQREEKGFEPGKLVDFQTEWVKPKQFSKELKAHFGCVNALAFSKNGTFLASGGDDRRILIWDVAKTLANKGQPLILKGTHESNVFGVNFDCLIKNVFSGGNDEKVLVHDLKTGQTLDVFPHDDPVYCVSPHPSHPELFATACSDGRILLFDLRSSNSDPIELQSTGFPFHGVNYNPIDPRLLVTANQNQGVFLIDARRPNKPIMKYGSKKDSSSMCASFSPDGSKIFALGRRSNPALYDLANPKPLVEFDHPGYFNSCTMKSGTFGGKDFVFSGSDDFNVYAWKIPDVEQGTFYVKRADFVLKGHRSIVNQVRFNPIFNLCATSGVEKKILLWSPFDIRTNSDGKCEKNGRKIGKRPNNFWSLDVNFDCEHESVEENPKMLAFFDSLVQRDLSSESETESTVSIETESEEEIDKVIAKKRQYIVAKRRKKRQDSSEYVRQTIEKAREALISSESSSEDEVIPELLKKPPENNLDPEMHNDILDIAFKAAQDAENSSSSDEATNNNTSRHTLFKKSKGGTKGRCYRTQN